MRFDHQETLVATVVIILLLVPLIVSITGLSVIETKERRKLALLNRHGPRNGLGDTVV